MEELRIASTAGAMSVGDTTASQVKSQKNAPRESAAKPTEPKESTSQNEEVDLAAAVRELSDRIGMDVELTTDEETGAPVVRINTPDGKRLVRQVPPEGVLTLLEQVESGKGIFEQSI